MIWRFKKPLDYSWNPRCFTFPSYWTPVSAPAERRTHLWVNREISLHPQDYSTIQSLQQVRHNRNDTANIFKLLQLASNFFKLKIEEMNLWDVTLVLSVFWIITRVTMSNFLCMIHWYFLEILFNLVHWLVFFFFLFYQRC